MALTAPEITEDLQARTSFSARDASGVVYTISRMLQDGTANLVTRDQLDARVAELTSQINGSKAELKGEVAELRSEIKTGLASVRADVAGVRGEMADLRSGVGVEFANVRKEMAEHRSGGGIEFANVRAEIAGVRGEISAAKADLQAVIRAQTQWFVGALIGVVGVATAIIKLLP